MHVDGDAARQIVLDAMGQGPAMHQPVFQDHLTGDLAEDATSEPDDPGVAVHQPGQPARPPDDDRQRQGDAEDDQDEVAARRRRHRQHVVEAHRDVGHDDDPDRLPHRGAPLELGLHPRLRLHELDGDPDEQDAAHQLQERHLEQVHDDAEEEQSQQHRAGRPPHLAQHALAPRQGAHGQRDDERVVARQQQIQVADLEEREPEPGIRQRIGHPLPSALDVRRSPSSPGRRPWRPPRAGGRPPARPPA